MLLIKILEQVWTFAPEPVSSEKEQNLHLAEFLISKAWEGLLGHSSWLKEAADEEEIPDTYRASEETYYHPLSIWIGLSRANCQAVLCHVHSLLRGSVSPAWKDWRFLWSHLPEVSFSSVAWDSWKKEVYQDISTKDLLKGHEEFPNFGSPLLRGAGEGAEEETKEFLTEAPKASISTGNGPVWFEEEGFEVLIESLKKGLFPIVEIKPQVKKGWMSWFVNMGGK